MRVTDVRVRALTGDPKVRAVCSVVLEGAFAVHGIRIVEGPKGLFVSMPRRKANDGSYHDVAHPITGELRQSLHDEILQTYHRATLERAGD